MPTRDTCRACKGSGIVPDEGEYTTKECSECKGDGIVYVAPPPYVAKKPTRVFDCNMSCPHKVMEHDLPGSSPWSCTHPSVGRVRLHSNPGIERPGWCPLDPIQDDLGLLGTCAACGARYEMEQAEWRETCRQCQHFLSMEKGEKGERRIVVERSQGVFAHREMMTIGREPTEHERRYSSSSFGFGAARFEIELLDKPGTVVVSHNLWTAGCIPPGLHYAFPITARIRRS